MHDGRGSHHLGVKHRPPGHLAVKDAAVPVGPVHHRGDGEAVGETDILRPNSPEPAAGKPSCWHTVRQIRREYELKMNAICLRQVKQP